MQKKEQITRYILLIIGVFFIGLGVALAKRSQLGISPVSSVANILNLKFKFFSMGTWLMIATPSPVSQFPERYERPCKA